MLDLSKKGIINLHAISITRVNRNIQKMLCEDEEVISAFVTIRDQIVFTTKRIITVEVHGVTGTQQDIFTLPYRKIQYFGVKTAGIGEAIPDSELTLYFSDGRAAQFHFHDKVNIVDIGRVISQNCL